MADSIYIAGFDLKTRDSNGALIPLTNTDVFVYRGVSLIETLTSDEFGYVSPLELSGTVGETLTFEADGFAGEYSQTAADSQEEAYIINKGLTFLADDDYAGETEAETVDIYMQDLSESGARPVYIGSVPPGSSLFYPFESAYSRDLRFFAIGKDASGRGSATDLSNAVQTDYTLPPNRENLTIGDTITGATANRILVVGSGGILAETPTIGANQSVRRNSGNTAFEAFTPMSGLTVGSTSISSGTNDRILFQASGAVSQSANLKFDSSNRLLIGNPTAAAQFHIKATADANKIAVLQQNSGTQTGSYLEAQSSGGTVHAKLQKDGYLTVGGITDGDSDYIALYCRTASNFPFRILHQTNGQLLNLSSAGDLNIAGSLHLNGAIYGANQYSAVYFTDEADTKGYWTTAISGVNWWLQNRVAGNIPMVVDSHASQTANLLEVRGLSSKTLSVDKDANIGMADGGNFIFGTSTGTKFGTSTSQKIGFFNATPVSQQNAPPFITDSLTGSLITTFDIGNLSGSDSVDLSYLIDVIKSLRHGQMTLRTALNNLGFTA